MTFLLKTNPQLFDLHCSVGLTDWDMDKELKLATTTDQFSHDDKVNEPYVIHRPSARASRRKDEFIWYDKTSDTFVKPNLWLLVNPNIACPLQYEDHLPPPPPPPPPSPSPSPPPPPPPLEPAEEMPLLEPAETQAPPAAQLHVLPPCEMSLRERLLQPVMIRSEDVCCQPAKTRRKGRSMKASEKTLKPGCWPRPPINYCILISLALKSSNSGSLKVQQIYNFTREHFPFFQTAPDGWKNTIRHNLCFNSSFRKTCNQLCRDGKRKSCFWHLTLDGHRRLSDEMRTLTRESCKQLERSMSHPGGGSLSSIEFSSEHQNRAVMMMVQSNILILLLLSRSVSGLQSVLVRNYWPMPYYYTWQQAQQICRSYYNSDLAIFYNQNDVNSWQLQSYTAWVGLRKTPSSNGWIDGSPLERGFANFQNWSWPNMDYSCGFLTEQNLFGATDCTEYNFFICHQYSSSYYIFITQTMTWSDAQQYCMSINNGGNLAVPKTQDRLNAAVRAWDFPIWTGLYRDGGTWRWSRGLSDYIKWAPNQPGADGDCVAINSQTKTMITRSCSARLPFVCYRDNLHLVKENVTWEEALEYCKTLGYYQLVSVQPADDYSYVMNRVMEADTDEVWTGLRFLAGSWVWINGADMSLSDLPTCPAPRQHCGAFSKNNTATLETRDCLEKKNFLCYGPW